MNDMDWFDELEHEQKKLTQTAGGFQEHLERITYALEQLQQSYADIQAKLARMEPLIEYAEQLVQQKERISKWLPGKR
jgi:DNA anti-recombination protein RmuC